MIPVMIIEDEFLVRVGLKTSIDWEGCGYEVVTEAEDGEGAVEKFRQFYPKLVVTDIRLPKKDGLEVMREIKKLDSNVKFIIVSAYDDFEVAREAITIGVENYFLKGSIDSEEVEETLQRIKKKNGWDEEYQDNGDIKERDIFYDFHAEEYGEGSWFVCVDTKNADTDKIIAMLQIVYAEKNIYYRIVKKSRQIIYMIALKEYSIHEIVKITEKVFRRYLNEKAYIGISGKREEEFEIKEAVWEAVLACEYAVKVSGNGCEFYQGSENAYENVKPVVNRFGDRFHFNKAFNSRGLLEEIFREFGKKYSVKDFYRLLYKIIGILADVDAEVIEGSIFSDLIDSMSYQDVLESLVMWFELYEEKVGADKENTYVTLVKEFIRDNLSEQLSLGALADAVHISPNYLGKVFRLNTGEYVTDCITRMRLEKATELLRERKYNICQIADMVGISDQRYFSKLFKKHYGMTPKDYMNNK